MSGQRSHWNRGRIAAACVSASGAVAACGVLVSVSGCGSGDGRQARTSVSAADFAVDDPSPGEPPAAARAAEVSATRSVRGADGRMGVTRTGPFAAREGVMDVVASPGEPTAVATATAAQAPVLIDAKVGDINGRAVFVSDFFSSMDARLRAEARTAKTRMDFAKVASREIARKLREIINDELLQAEARSSLTPEQRQGFRYWVQSLQADYVSRNYRSRTMAEQRLAEAQEASSLEEWTRKREERELIMLQLREQVLKNVHVPFREVEMNYNRRYEEFNPPERMQFRVISIPRGDTASIESARTDLESGTDFAEVASRPFNLFRSSEGGLYIPPPAPAAGAGPDGVTAERKYFEIPALNEAAHRMTSGSWSGPIETGSTVSFLRLDVIREPSTSLYEAQVSIEQSLRSAKTEQLMVKYIDQLVKRASVDDIEEMGQRLLDASMERYWISQRGT